MRRRLQRFELLGELGVGGMGAVYRARDPQLQREVAIKVIAKPVTQARDLLATRQTIDLHEGPTGDLLAEARLMAKLSHPNVLPVYELGFADGEVFVVMELIAGKDLRAWLGTPRSVREIAGVFAQAARGLAAAHAQGIVHRDVKPENVLVGDDGRVRVADFGLSRLTEVAPLLRVEAATAGTPEYMAPELFTGAAATDRADVFALCRALDEALGDRASARVRAVIAAGSVDDPAKRPAIGAVIAALEPKRTLWPIALGGTLVAAGGVALVVLWPGKPACVASSVRYAPPWDRAALGQLGVTDALDKRAQAIRGALADACSAEREGALTPDQARVRLSCVQRRALELDVRVAHLLASKQVAEARDGYGPHDCADVIAPPLPADSSLIPAMYQRLVGAEHGVIGSPARTAGLVALSHDAHALGERELEARVELSLGERQIETDDLTGADASLARAYDIGIAIHSRAIAAEALVKRSVGANDRGDASAARAYAQLAVDTVDKPDASIEQRVSVYEQLAEAEVAHGDISAALERLRTATALLASAPEHTTELELSVRFATIVALSDTGKDADRALALARDTVAYAMQHTPRDSPDYGIALNILAIQLRLTGAADEALGYRRKALAVLEHALPADHSSVLVQRMNVADDLDALGRYAEAVDEAGKVVDGSVDNEKIATVRPYWQADYGALLIHANRVDEGLDRFERGVDAMISQKGDAHPDVLEFRREHIALLTDAGKLDDAEHRLAALDHTLHDKRDTLGITRLDGIDRARLLLARGKPRDAETHARAALAAWPELHGDAGDRIDLLHVLADALLAQHRDADAAAAYDEALAIADKRHEPAPRRAPLEAGHAKAVHK